MELPKRKPNRLKNYDYSSNGAYFITFCTHERKQTLCRIVGAIHVSPEVILTPLGETVAQIIHTLPDRYNIKIDAHAIMPNHVHLLIAIDNPDDLRAIRQSPLRSRSIISQVVGYLKMQTYKQAHRAGISGSIWQRSFHDHIIRSLEDYGKIFDYVRLNPQLWLDDCYFSME